MASKRKSAAPIGARKSPSVEIEESTGIDVSALRQIVEILEASEVSRLEWTKGDERLLIRRNAPMTPSFMAPQMSANPSVVAIAPQPVPVTVAAPAAAPAAAPVAEKPGQVVTSPFVGTFYRSPSPDQAHFVEVGSVVRKGQTICIVEAMKLMNEIESEFAGKVTEVLVQNGQPVEFGQPLFRIEKV